LNTVYIQQGFGLKAKVFGLEGFDLATTASTLSGLRRQTLSSTSKL